MLAVMWTDLAWLGLFPPNACLACQQPLFRRAERQRYTAALVAQAWPAQSPSLQMMQELHVDGRLD